MLSIAQRAERAARKRNKKIAQEYPLFAGQFDVTVESQVERLEKQEIDNEKFFKRIHELNERQYREGLVYRDVASMELSPEKFAEYETRYQRIFGNRSIDAQGEWLVDWWHCALRDNGSSWLQNNCPRSEMHEWEVYQREGRCPSCGRHLTPLAPDKSGDSPVQSALFTLEVLPTNQAGTLSPAFAGKA
jgi:hypothetical protein